MERATNQPNLFDYTDAAAYLRDLLAYKKTRNPGFSARAWAQKMGFKGHTSLVFFLNGNRKLKARHLPGLFRALDLDEFEEKYFAALVHFGAAQTPVEREIHAAWLERCHPSSEATFIDLERFRLIAHWMHTVILELVELKDFRNDPKWISARLGGKVTPAQASEALERLERLGMLRLENNAYRREHAQWTTPKDRPSRAIREHHHQVLELATKALEEQSVEERDFNSCAMTIDASKLDEAKELIREFRGRMNQLMEKKGGDETYLLAVQFFRATHPLKQEERESE